MSPNEHGREGSTARVLRIPTPAGSGLVLEHRSRTLDLSQGLPHAKRGDLLELIARGLFDDPEGLTAATLAQFPRCSAPLSLLTPFEPRHVGKVLALSSSPRQWREATPEQEPRARFSNRSPATLIAGGQSVEPAHPAGSGEPGGSFLIHEAYLALVVSTRARGLDLDSSLGAIAGFMVASDFTRRTLDGRPSTPWFGPSPCGALAIGPAFVPRSCFDLGDVTIRVRRTRGGSQEPEQRHSTGEFLHDAALAVAAISRLAILHPGDLLLLPTGLGAGRLEAGDEVRCTIDGIGELTTGICSRERLYKQA